MVEDLSENGCDDAVSADNLPSLSDVTIVDGRGYWARQGEDAGLLVNKYVITGCIG